MQNKKGYLRTLILSAESAIYNKLTDEEKIKNSRSAWENIQGENWFYQDMKRSSIDSLIKRRSELIKMLDLYIHSKKEIKTICEMGTGDGRFLKYMQNRYSNIDNFIGIDINDKIIKRNKEYYSKSNLLFIEGHISEKLEEVFKVANNEPVLLVTTRTFTWFTQSELEHFLALAKKTSEDVSLAFFEQNDINLKREFNSRVRCDIYFMSHNYPYLLRNLGWNILSQKVKYNNRILNDYGINILATNEKNVVEYPDADISR